MRSRDAAAQSAAKIDATFAKHGVQLTLGGEPTYVPLEPLGSEWNVTALGPTKLSYAWALADRLIANILPHALALLSPGKSYPGEANPRWVLQLVWRKDGRRLFAVAPVAKSCGTRALRQFRDELLKELRLPRARWLRGRNPDDSSAWIIPLDHNGRRFISANWGLGRSIQLLDASGAAGLRLPLGQLPADISRRALTLEVRAQVLEIFLPPLRQDAFLRLLAAIQRAALRSKCGRISFAGYLPWDETNSWGVLGIASDPGVLEINLPPSQSDREYAHWMGALESAAAGANLRSFKELASGEQIPTGGGNHLLFGGPTLDENPFFTRPRWLCSILRYWQHHPSLAYLFTGGYVGAASQAPRPDESANALADLEMSYRFLEELPPGDHRALIGETLRHLHADTSGNTHRSEISFDKFWNISFDGGCRGLIEFRALETFPSAHSMATIGQLWRALAAMLLARPFTKPLRDFGRSLHDAFFLPSHLWNDFEAVLRDLRREGFRFSEEVFRGMFDWRFPVLLDHRDGAGFLRVRKAHEGWPLLCETPLEGGHTSRFVDSSIERLEFIANRHFQRHCRVFVQGRLLPLLPFSAQYGAGLRYRRSALTPSLHPGIPPQLPLRVEIRRGQAESVYELREGKRLFERLEPASISRRPVRRAVVRKASPELLTFDLRLP